MPQPRHCALGAALVVDNPTVDGGALAHVVKRHCCQSKTKAIAKREHYYFSHGRFLLLKFRLRPHRRKSSTIDCAEDRAVPCREPALPRSIVK